MVGTSGIRPQSSSSGEVLAGGSSGVIDEAEEEANVDETAEEVYDNVDPEEVFVKVLPSPCKPCLREVEEHNATHLPYRNWCPVCVKSRGRADAHVTVTRRDGVPMVSLDYKSFGECLEDVENTEEGKLRAMVMKDHETGMLSGYLIECKGDGDKWLLDKLAEDIADWGRTDIVLKTDGEPAILKVQKAIAERRSKATIPRESSGI